MQAAFAELEAGVTAFEGRRAELRPGYRRRQLSWSCVRQLEQISRMAYRIYGFAEPELRRRHPGPGRPGLPGAASSRSWRELENRTLFFSLWWKDLDDANADRLMAASGDYRYWLEEMRHFKPHTLTEPEEKIVNIKNVTGVERPEQPVRRHHQPLCLQAEGGWRGEGADPRRADGLRPRPRPRPARAQPTRSCTGSTGRTARSWGRSTRPWCATGATSRSTCAISPPRSPPATWSTISPTRWWIPCWRCAERNAARLPALFPPESPPAGHGRACAAMISMPRWPNPTRRYDFDAGGRDGAGLFRPASTRSLAELAQRVFDQDHLDSEVRKGKRGGAFCATVTPDLTPWVLVNYQGRADDVATMAHELGHAIHSMLADRSQPVHPALLPAAGRNRLHLWRDDAGRPPAGSRRTTRACAATCSSARWMTPTPPSMRQAFFALFERQAHEMIKQGASVDELAAAYLENLKEPVRRCGGGERRVPLGMGLDPAYLPGAVLCVCLCLRAAAGALALPAVQGRRRGLQAALPQDPVGGRLRSPGQDPGRGRDRYPPAPPSGRAALMSSSA